MMAFILATDFDFIAYMSKMAFFLGSFFHTNRERERETTNNYVVMEKKM